MILVSHAIARIFRRSTVAALVCVCIVSGCSSSSSDDSDAGISDVAMSEELESTDAPSATDANANDTITNEDDQATTDDSQTISDNEQSETSTDTIGVDPQNPSSTLVTFNITVPAYMSDALQVRITWAETNIAAQWVGDEFWSVAADFPTDTENVLNVTFFDDNGATPLGDVEQVFRTGINASQTIDISAGQFDTDRFDANNNGVSNFDELSAAGQTQAAANILLFSETRDYRHPSIGDALVALQEIATGAGIQTDLAGDSLGVFTESNLANYDAIIWVLTSGDVLDDTEQAVFENYIQSGGGFAGIHAASDTEYEWPWYGQLVGAYFEDHPAIQTATQDVEDSSHQSTAHLNLTWTRTDEWYNYNANPRARVNVLLSLDETSYSGGTMGGDHPSAWYHEFDGGRAWYTGGGHTSESYAEPDFRAHLLGGLQYAAGIDG